MKKERLVCLILIFVLCLAILTSCTVIRGDKGDATEPGDEETIGVVTIVIDDKEITKPAQYDSLHALLIELKNTGEISRYNYGYNGDRVYPIAIDKYEDYVDGNLLIYHNIEDTTLYTTNNIMRIDGVTFRCSIVGLNELPAKAGVKYLIVCE